MNSNSFHYPQANQPRHEHQPQHEHQPSAKTTGAARTFTIQLQGGLQPRLLRLGRAGRLGRPCAMPLPAGLRGVSQVHKQAAHLQAICTKSNGWQKRE